MPHTTISLLLSPQAWFVFSLSSAKKGSSVRKGFLLCHAGRESSHLICLLLEQRVKAVCRVQQEDAAYNCRKTKFIECFKLHVSADYFCRTQCYFLLRPESAFFSLFLCYLHFVALYPCCSSACSLRLIVPLLTKKVGL